MTEEQITNIETGADQLVKQGYLSPTKRDAFVRDQISQLEVKTEKPKKKGKK